MASIRIQMLTRSAGPDGHVAPGTILTLPPKQAQALIDSRQAIRVDGQGERVPEKETASLSHADAETATK